MISVRSSCGSISVLQPYYVKRFGGIKFKRACVHSFFKADFFLAIPGNRERKEVSYSHSYQVSEDSGPIYVHAVNSSIKRYEAIQVETPMRYR